MNKIDARRKTKKSGTAKKSGQKIPKSQNILCRQLLSPAIEVRLPMALQQSVCDADKPTLTCFHIAHRRKNMIYL
jgi:hypothetical protein